MNFRDHSFLKTAKDHIELIHQLISQCDHVGLLASISDRQWLQNTRLQLAVLQDHGLINLLLDIPDSYIQFATFNIIKEILLTSTSKAEVAISTGVSLHHNHTFKQQRRSLVFELFQRLLNTNHHHHQQQQQQQQEQQQQSHSIQRAILELFHQLLKHHRNLVRHLDKKQDEYLKNHVAKDVVQELIQPTFWKLPFEDLIGLKDIQFATLVLLIDIEKARFLDNVNDSSFVRNISTCHSNIVGSVSQLLDLSKFRPHALRKLLELLCLTLKPTTREHETEIDQDTRLLLPIQIVTALSPITLKAIQALHCHDQHLDNLLAGTTGFIFTENSSYFGIDKELQPIVSNPEVIRQLGRVFLTAALSTLDTLIVMARDSKLKSHHDFSDGRMESLSRIRSIVLATQTFIHSWIGPNTLDILLTIYGEDDAGLSWLLKTMSLIDCKIHDIQSNYYQFLSSKDLLIQDEFNDLYIHLHRYAYPMDALFKFLETIGFDYQTLLDLLLTLDDQQTGGMLAALMAILRNFTERESDQYNLSERWRRAVEGRVKAALEEREVALSEKFYVPFDDDVEPLSIENKCGNDDGSSDTRLILLNVEFCFSKLAQHIRRLHEKDLFPYNPRALLVVLDRTQLVLLSIINSK